MIFGCESISSAIRCAEASGLIVESRRSRNVKMVSQRVDVVSRVGLLADIRSSQSFWPAMYFSTRVTCSIAEDVRLKSRLVFEHRPFTLLFTIMRLE